MNDNYIILRDEDGKAYIAHADVAVTQQGGRQYANWGKGAQRAGHKYIARLLENGKYWYAYTQQELQAHLQGAKNKARNTVEEATGVAARKRMDAAAEKYPELERNRRAQNQAYRNAKVNTDRAAKKMTDAYRSTDEAENRAKNSNIFNRKQRNAEAAIAKAQEEQYYQSHKNAQKAEIEQKRKKEQTDRAYAEGNADYQANKHAYDNSLAGLVDRTAAGTRQAASNAKNAANNAVTKAKNAYERMRGELRDKAREAIGNSDHERMDKAVERRDAWNNELEKQRKNRESARKEFDQALDDRIKTQLDEADAKAMYSSSSLFNRSKSKKVYDVAQEKTKAADKKYQEALNNVSRAQTSYSNAQKNANKAEETYQKEKDSYDRSLAGTYDRISSKAKEVAGNARDSINDMLDATSNKVKDIAGAIDSKAAKGVDSVTDMLNVPVDKAKEIAGVYKRMDRDRTKFEAEQPGANVYDKTRANISQRVYDKTPLGMLERARVAAKDKSEDLSAKAKSTAQSARDSVQGMIENARSSTDKAVNEAWDKIPKNADGTVNIFDKNFQSAYNDWKAKKDKYDSSLAGRAKDAAEKATDSVQAMIDKAKKAVKDNSGSTNARATKSSYGEYSDNDKDFAEENYSDKNHVEDTDFYTFKRPDGQWVILEEDMKWVLPKGVTGNDPAVRNALKQFADRASSAKAIGNENYNIDQWVDAVTDAIDKAAEKQRKR